MIAVWLELGHHSMERREAIFGALTEQRLEM